MFNLHSDVELVPKKHLNSQNSVHRLYIAKAELLHLFEFSEKKRKVKKIHLFEVPRIEACLRHFLFH